MRLRIWNLSDSPLRYVRTYVYMCVVSGRQMDTGAQQTIAGRPELEDG